MQKKKLIIVGLAFFIIISLLAYFIFVKGGKSRLSYFKNQAVQTEVLNIEDKKIADNTNPFKIDISYPYIAEQNDFNVLVKNIIDGEISDFKRNSLENDNAVKETDPVNYNKYPREYDLIISYDKGQVDSQLISVVFDISNYTGGAHGARYQISLNYNQKDKKEITLADVFSNQKDYLQKISDFCVADITKQITAIGQSTDGTWIKDGAGPLAENFNIFLINKDSITFYFPQYQVAPYVFGEFKVTMPR